MTIQALPSSTVYVIGAAQILTSPVALIKELLDNAIDAGCSSIFIELSSNSLDIVQVRDNGHGIAPDDRDLIVKRSCTSKIRNAEELVAIGGSSLGFRGEALSSAANISAGLTITTRVDGEHVASALSFGRMGSITKQETVSHPTGTTVRVTGFLEHNVVRRKTMEKSAAKNIAATKSLLQAYAFARPKIRLSFKVLKSLSVKDNWTFAATPGATLVEDAMRIVSRACISQCSLHQGSDGEYDIVGLLPNMQAAPTDITGVGQYVSIDRRPMSTSRGIGHRIAGVYRGLLRESCDTFSNVREPFLYLSLTCPVGVYDANVEPAKDDLLFGDEYKLLSILGQFFARTYTKRRPPSEINDKPTASRPSRKDRQGQTMQNDDIPGDNRNSSGAMMQTMSPPEDDTPEGHHKDMSISNPWTLARINTMGQRRVKSAAQIAPHFINDSMNDKQGLITPDASSPTPGSRSLSMQHHPLQISPTLTPQLRPVLSLTPSRVADELYEYKRPLHERCTVPENESAPLRHKAIPSLEAPLMTSSRNTNTRPEQSPIMPCFTPLQRSDRQFMDLAPKSGSPLAQVPSHSSSTGMASKVAKKNLNTLNKPFKPQIPGTVKTKSSRGDTRAWKEVYETCEVIPSINRVGIDRETVVDESVSASPVRNQQQGHAVRQPTQQRVPTRLMPRQHAQDHRAASDQREEYSSLVPTRRDGTFNSGRSQSRIDESVVPMDSSAAGKHGSMNSIDIANYFRVAPAQQPLPLHKSAQSVHEAQASQSGQTSALDGLADEPPLIGTSKTVTCSLKTSIAGLRHGEFVDAAHATWGRRIGLAELDLAFDGLASDSRALRVVIARLESLLHMLHADRCYDRAELEGALMAGLEIWRRTMESSG